MRSESSLPLKKYRQIKRTSDGLALIPDWAERDEEGGERDGAERRQRGPELHDSPYD